MAVIKISDEWLRECMQERISDAVKYGIRRAYKHSDLSPPSDTQVDAIIDEVNSAVDSMVAWYQQSE